MENKRALQIGERIWLKNNIHKPDSQVIEWPAGLSGLVTSSGNFHCAVLFDGQNKPTLQVPISFVTTQKPY